MNIGFSLLERCISAKQDEGQNPKDRWPTAHACGRLSSRWPAERIFGSLFSGLWVR
jgi:hypothetical protein